MKNLHFDYRIQWLREAIDTPLTYYPASYAIQRWWKSEQNKDNQKQLDLYLSGEGRLWKINF